MKKISQPRSHINHVAGENFDFRKIQWALFAQKRTAWAEKTFVFDLECDNYSASVPSASEWLIIQTFPLIPYELMFPQTILRERPSSSIVSVFNEINKLLRDLEHVQITHNLIISQLKSTKTQKRF